VPFQGEIRLGEFLSPPEQARGDKEIGKKRPPEAPTRLYRAEFRSAGRRTIEYGRLAITAAEDARTRRDGRFALSAPRFINLHPQLALY
jgi:hypothetical protein